jgi:Putative beta-barrel porin-2, OmpL-like. bbp2
MIRIPLLAFVLVLCVHTHGQSVPVPVENVPLASDTTAAQALLISGYAEVYFAYDLSSPGNGERPPFLYNYRRHNEVSVNLAYLKAAYVKDRVRANLALMTGTYPQYNLAAEPPPLRNLLEANIGVKLSTRHDLWLDAGVLPSHIGFESATGADCWNLTRSVWAENTPYFEAGARLTYKPNERLTLAALYLNGWQRIQRQGGNSTPAFGTQVNRITTNGTQLNWSTFIGQETPDSVGLWRFYNNFYAVFDGDSTGLTLGFDLGLQQLTDKSLGGWFGPVVMVRERFCKNWWGVGRVEFFSDEDRIVLPVQRPMMSASLGVDKWITDDVLWRMEVRWLGNEDPVFMDVDQRAVSGNWAITTALCAKF